MNKRLLSHILKLLVEAEDLYSKGTKRLLKVEVRDDFEDRFWSLISKNKKTLDEESRLEFERDFERKGTRWHIQGEVFLHNDKALSSIDPRKKFLERVIERTNVKIPSKSAYIQAGKPYTAREYMKKLLATASKVIFVDNYFNPVVFPLLEEILDSNPKLKIVILRSEAKSKQDIAVVKALVNTTKSFNVQYNNAVTELRTHNSLPLHDRFILADDLLYQSGHSFHGWGVKATRISLVEEPTEIDKILVDIKNWLSTGQNII